MDSLLFKRLILLKIIIIEKPQRVLLPDLIFKLQEKVLKFNDICMSWSSPKTDLVKKN